MSEIPYFPTFDNVDNKVTLTNGVYNIKDVMLVAPFEMVNISNEQIFSNKQPNEQIFVSRLPLFDNNYWFFDLISANQIDVTMRDEPYFFQQEDILKNNSNVSFSFFKTTAPLYMSRVNSQFKEYPFTYPSLQMQTGKVQNVAMIDLNDQSVLLNVDHLQIDLDSNDLALINQIRIQEQNGLMGREVSE